MTRTGVSLLIALVFWIVAFVAFTGLKRQRDPTSFGRDLALYETRWVISGAGTDFQIDYGQVWFDMNSNPDISESVVGVASVSTTAPFLRHRFDEDPFQVSETSAVISTITDFGSAGGGAGTTVVTIVGGESTLVSDRQSQDAPSRMRRSGTCHGGWAAASNLCPTVGAFNHPMASSSVTHNMAA